MTSETEVPFSLRRTLVAGAVASAVGLSAAPALAQMVCGNHADIEKRLEAGYKEVRTAIGLAANGGLIELYSSEDGTFTVQESPSHSQTSREKLFSSISGPHGVCHAVKKFLISSSSTRKTKIMVPSSLAFLWIKAQTKSVISRVNMASIILLPWQLMQWSKITNPASSSPQP